MLVVVLELVGNLGPEVLVTGFGLLVIVIVGNDPGIIVSTSVMMHVDNTIESCIDDVVDHLVYTLYPRCIHISVTIYMGIPCDRNSDGSETSLFHHRYQFRLCDRLSPICF